MTPLRLGLFGGTFDPPHIGHLIVAQDVVETLGLDRLLFVPAGSPPHKTDRAVSPAPLRLEMVEGITADNGTFGVSDFELTREGPSYTVDTLRHYRGLYPEAEIFFVLGADQAAALDTWQDPDRVAALATLVVMARAGATVPVGEFASVPVTRVDISATEIRRRVLGGRSIRYLVPESVREIIDRNRLYRTES
ncbi:MAG: nicotinate-nucleotide adenylyltransferase [Longimicrobiales bacterium]